MIRYLIRLNHLLYCLLALVLICVVFNWPELVLGKFYPVKYQQVVTRFCAEYGVDPYLAYAVIKNESAFNANAQSHKDARGLMQIAAETGKRGARQLKLGQINPDDLFNPEVNIRIGVWYLSVLQKEFGYDKRLVIAAYNCGEGKVRMWLADRKLSPDGKYLKRIPYIETYHFVNKVMNDYAVYSRLYSQ